jgi:hypothetical protein
MVEVDQTKEEQNRKEKQKNAFSDGPQPDPKANLRRVLAGVAVDDGIETEAFGGCRRRFFFLLGAMMLCNAIGDAAEKRPTVTSLVLLGEIRYRSRGVRDMSCIIIIHGRNHRDVFSLLSRHPRSTIHDTTMDSNIIDIVYTAVLSV